MGRRQGGGVVDAVADHKRRRALGFERFNSGDLLLRLQARAPAIQTQRLRGGLHRSLPVSGQQFRVKPLRLQPGNRVRRITAQRVGEDEAHRGVARNQQPGFLSRVAVAGRQAKPVGGPKADRPAVHDAGQAAAGAVLKRLADRAVAGRIRHGARKRVARQAGELRGGLQRVSGDAAAIEQPGAAFGQRAGFVEDRGARGREPLQRVTGFDQHAVFEQPSGGDDLHGRHDPTSAMAQGQVMINTAIAFIRES